MAANTGSSLHLIEPLGFSLDAKKLRRAGLDYHEFADIQSYPNWPTFQQQNPAARLFGLSTKASRSYSQAKFEKGDFLLFGPETRGLPAAIREELGTEQLLRIPMRPDSRSLNLSNAVAVLVYEAWRQLGFEAGA